MSENKESKGGPPRSSSADHINLMQLSHNEHVTNEGNRLYKQFLYRDPYLWWFKQPHTISMLIFCGAILVYVAYTRDVRVGFESNTKSGLMAVGLCYLLFSATQMKDGLIVRPHPIFWRVIMGMGVLYALLLIFTLFQTADDARSLLKSIDSKLGVELPERSYAENCTLYTPDHPESNFKHMMDTINDEFMLAHFFGWFGKALLLRDWYLCWIMSVLFELMEISLKHLLPNFAECWWDHIILDILTMNLFGIMLGLKTCEWFSIKPYNWIAANIRPELETYDWGVLKSWRRLGSVILLIGTVTLVELNAFFLKFVLWIPPPHPINIIRLFLWWAMGLPGVREFYQFVTDPNCKRFGTMSWLCAAIAVLEMLVWVKFGMGMFPNPTPPAVIYSWTAAISVLFVWAVWFYGIRQPSQAHGTKKVVKKD